MTLEWLRGEDVILQRSIAENPMFPESVVLIMAADQDAEGDVTAHHFDRRLESTLPDVGQTIYSSCYLVDDGDVGDREVRWSRGTQLTGLRGHNDAGSRFT